MEPIEIYRSVSEQVAIWYLANYEELGAQSVKELALQAGVSSDTMRHALRIAQDRLNGQGKTLTHAEAAHKWRIEVTDRQRAALLSARGRFSAIASELTRIKAGGEACTYRDEEVGRVIEDVEVACSLALESLANI